jgi:hypothetical protein
MSDGDTDYLKEAGEDTGSGYSQAPTKPLLRDISVGDMQDVNLNEGMWLRLSIDSVASTIHQPMTRVLNGGERLRCTQD